MAGTACRMPPSPRGRGTPAPALAAVAVADGVHWCGRGVAVALGLIGHPLGPLPSTAALPRAPSFCAAGHPYDEKCDLWSLGVLTYILLCGWPPFFATSTALLFEKISLGYPPVFLGSLRGFLVAAGAAPPLGTPEL